MTTACLKNYVGIGDTLYLTIGIKEILKDYDEIVLTTPVAILLRGMIPGIKFVDPTPNNSHLMTVPPEFDLMTRPHYQPFLTGMRGMNLLETWPEDEVTHWCSGNGEGFLEGRFYQEQMVVNDVARRLESEPGPFKMSFVDRDACADQAVEQWFHNRNLDPSKTIVMHTHWRGWNFKELPWYHVFSTHIVHDHVMVKARQVVESMGYKIIDMEFPWPLTLGVFHDIPVLNSFGPGGFWSTCAAIRMCRGVIMQGSCRLLPLAQHFQKPTLVFRQGGHPLKHLNWPKLDCPQFVECQPEQFHHCGQAICEECWHNNVTDEQIEHSIETMLSVSAN